MIEPMENLLPWYRRNARKDLPWRKNKEPYRIWISEIMLQQTQVSKVTSHYQRFLKKFPNVKTLATAPLTRVLDAWSGLGYYSRAKNLHQAAQVIHRDHNGKIPTEVSQLLSLPGVGRYTAGAIASIAYDRPAPILDGNVIRVLCRYFGIQGNPQEPAIQKKLWALSAQLVPTDSPGDFNQALMELGALVCTPRSPQCPACPLTKSCIAYKRGWQDRLPQPRAVALKKKILYPCGIIERNGRFLLARRPLAGLLPGLWEFPGGEKADGKSLEESLARSLSQRLGIRVLPAAHRPVIKQVLSHREIAIHPFECSWNGHRLSPKWYLETQWVPRRRLKEMPLTAGMLRLAKTLTNTNAPEIVTSMAGFSSRRCNGIKDVCIRAATRRSAPPCGRR